MENYNHRINPRVIIFVLLILINIMLIITLISTKTELQSYKEDPFFLSSAYCPSKIEKSQTLKRGTYEVGKDINAGVYDIEATFGYGKLTCGSNDNQISTEIGNIIHPKKYRKVLLYNGDNIDIDGIVRIKFSLRSMDEW